MPQAKPEFGGSNTAKLKEAFRLAMENDPPPASKEDAADFIIERNAATLQAWARERLIISLIAPLWPKSAEPYQDFLFTEHELQQKLPQPEGKPVKLIDATITQLRASIIPSVRAAKAGAARRLDPKLEKRQQLINEMAPYAAAHHSKDTPFTVGRYRQMRADGVPPPSGTYDRSAAAKAAWAKMTPAERARSRRKRPRKPKK